MQALDDRHEVELRVPPCQSIRQDVANGQVDGLLVQVVRKDDEAAVECRSGLEDGVELLDDLRDGFARGDVPVLRVELFAARRTCPDDGREVHGLADGANAVVNVAVWWTHGVGRDTGDLANGFASPAKFGDDLFVRERGCLGH